ncbi:sensor histidine kinase [Arthrobacter woluwensis]|uniref:sensor histidine kinase n=1 Tax=Arthrobacter woluwensis TaxID=156980 RepID=UPI001AAE4032|nr:ATP-binding protein [Arthrobacter woluwensis]QTF73547.1 GHKL domain-containing protein [Arthrobacter woluwensis]
MGRWSIARRLFVANLLLVLTAAIAASAFAAVDIRTRSYDDAGQRTQSVAATVAASPFVVQAAVSPEPSATLQPYAEAVMRRGHVDFLTIMSPDTTRWTHANPAEIGKKYLGTVEPALRGQDFTETYTGTLGASVRTIVPVKNPSGRVVALVSAGVTVQNVDAGITWRLLAILGLAAALVTGGALVAWLLGRYLRRVTHGWGAEQLAQLFAYYESVLHSVREGVVLVDTRGRVVMYNDQAAELLGLDSPGSAGSPGAAASREAAQAPSSGSGPGAAAPPTVAELPLEPSLRDLFTSGREARDEVHLAGPRLLVVNQQAAVEQDSGTRSRPRRLGTVATLRDRTEIESLGSELATTRTLSDALRAQTHEHANRLHLMVSLMELGRTPEALELATRDLELGQRLADDLLGSVDEPVLAALVMGKSAEAHERGVLLELHGGSTPAALDIPVQDLVTILGNLLDNAIDAAAAAEAPRLVRLGITADEGGVTFTVQDSGAGLGEGQLERAFEFGYSTKESRHGRGVGLALVRQTVRRLDGTLEVEAGHAPSSVSAPREPGELPGARFVVTLPLHGGPAETPEGES